MSCFVNIVPVGKTTVDFSFSSSIGKEIFLAHLEYLFPFSQVINSKPFPKKSKQIYKYYFLGADRSGYFEVADGIEYMMTRSDNRTKYNNL